MDNYLINTAEFQLTQGEFLMRLLIACGIGFLIGLEREHTALAKKEEAFAGIRTFIFLSLIGFIGAAMHFFFGPWILAGVVFSVILLTAISYWITAAKGDIGGTAELTTIIAVLLGAMTFLGHIEVSLMITVIMVVLLSSKFKLQQVIGQISHEELYDFIRFVVIALLLFPFLPDETYGPYDVINPREIGWVIIVTSGVGLAGYLLMRVLGAHKGILLTGIIGGLVSSTAVTWVFSKKSKESPTLSAYCAIAILAASSIMVIRVMIWIFIFNRDLFVDLALPLILVFVAALGVTLLFFIKNKADKKVDADIDPGKPLNLKAAVVFGVLYTIITIAVAYANNVFGEEGIYVASGIAGLSDVDAITISVSKLAIGSISALSAQNAILIATISNTLVKMGIAIATGSNELRKYIFIGYGTIFVAALIGFAIMNL